MDSKKKPYVPTPEDLEVRSRQLDPEHPNYWKSRGYPDRPDNWEDILKAGEKKKP